MKFSNCKPKFIFAIVLVGSLLIDCGRSIGSSSSLSPIPRPGNYTREISVGGMKRTYLLHIPAKFNLQQPMPLLIMLHGAGGTGEISMKETGWDKKADRGGFLAVFPDGTRPYPEKRARFRENPQTWNDGSNRKNVGATQRHVDDIAFVNALLDDVIAHFNVDQKRIFVTGFSNGASMAFRVGRELSNRIAAIAPASGTDWLVKPAVNRPVSLFYITGSADPLNPLNGGEQRLLGRTVGHKPPVQLQIDAWVEMLGCPRTQQSLKSIDGIKAVRYGPCAKGSEVVYYTIEGMGTPGPEGKARFLNSWLERLQIRSMPMM